MHENKEKILALLSGKEVERKVNSSIKTTRLSHKLGYGARRRVGLLHDFMAGNGLNGGKSTGPERCRNQI